jgi:hypothetical protein
MHITLLAASLLVNAGSVSAPIAGIETTLNLAGRGGVTFAATVTSQSGRSGASVGIECSPAPTVAVPNPAWVLMAPVLTVDSTGNKADTTVTGGIDYESIPAACQVSGARVRAVASGNGGTTNFTLTQLHLEVL